MFGAALGGKCAGSDATEQDFDFSGPGRKEGENYVSKMWLLAV